MNSGVVFTSLDNCSIRRNIVYKGLLSLLTPPANLVRGRGVPTHSQVK